MKISTVRGRLRALFMIFLMVLFSLSCSDDFADLDIQAEAQQDTELLTKTATIVDNTISGEHENGGYWQISLPEYWNYMEVRHLIIYAHGYVDAVDPVQLPADEIGGVPIMNLVNSAGVAFASTSYRMNGLVVKEGILDLLDLRAIIDEYLDGTHGFLPPSFVYLGGVSEGGLIGALTLEQHPHLFDGGLLTCCPIGNFYKQLQYFGDFHVLFNYFFKAELLAAGIDLGNPTGVPEATMLAWKTGALQPLFIGMLSQNPAKVLQLLQTAKVRVDKTDEVAIGTAILELLRFNIMATNDAIIKLGGCPYNNLMPQRRYFGSANDLHLNANVERIKCDTWAAARDEVNAFYQTTGDLSLPTVELHNLGDHISPYWHQIAYMAKVSANRDFVYYIHRPVMRFGHCNFTQDEITMALQTMIFRVTGASGLMPPLASKAE